MASISAQNLGFDYPIYDLKARSLKMALTRQFVGGSLRDHRGRLLVEALRDIDLELKDGDRLGLIGHNGSGKTTLLRVLAGLYKPQYGQLNIEGRVVPLIEKGVGIAPELSGHDNLELPLRLLGANDDEVKFAKREIPEFTGLGPYMHLPVRTYSEGMRTRLAFAICTSIQADILVLDEWLSAGDLEFQERANTRLNDLLRNTRILVVASHSMHLVENVCSHAALMEGGRIIATGAPNPICSRYAETPVPTLPEPVF